MPASNDPQLMETVAVPQHYQPATVRERRVQAIKRLQVGAGGIAVMLLIVGLANIIMDRARQNEIVAESGPASLDAASEKASDPLADIGLVPSSDPDPAKSPSKAPQQP